MINVEEKYTQVHPYLSLFPSLSLSLPPSLFPSPYSSIATSFSRRTKEVEDKGYKQFKGKINKCVPPNNTVSKEAKENETRNEKFGNVSFLEIK